MLQYCINTLYPIPLISLQKNVLDFCMVFYGSDSPDWTVLAYAFLTTSEMSVIPHQQPKRPLARPSLTTGVLQGPPQNLEALWSNQVFHDHQQKGISLLSPS